MKILIAGDFCPQLRVAQSFERGDYASVLGDVESVVKDADYSIVNFECPVTRGGEAPIEKIGPNLQCSDSGMLAVKWAGFNCVTLANNHFLDFGAEGVKNTLGVCSKHGIDTVGGGMNLPEASRTLYKKIGNETLAIINCCEHEFSIATETTAGSNPLNPIQQYYAIKEARGKANYVVVIVHGGHEHFQLPSPRMVETYRFFIDAGADAVVNHHQHCYSGYEVYQGKPIFYGLGNFCFDTSPVRTDDKWNYGYMAELELEKGAVSYQIHPYKQCSEQVGVKMLPSDAFDTRFKELNAVIADSKQLGENTSQYYASAAKGIHSVFEPIQNRIIAGLQRRHLLPSLVTKKWQLKMENFIMCEAHRDKVADYLHNIRTLQ